MKNILILFSLLILKQITCAQNNVGFVISMPISNTIKSIDDPLLYSGNTQMNMNLELFYQRETKKQIHHIGFSNQVFAFNYLDSNIRKYTSESYATINYSYLLKKELGNFNLLIGSGLLFSILNNQKNYRVNTTNLVNEYTSGKIIKVGIYIDTRIPLPQNSTKKFKLNQTINFRLGSDLAAFKSASITAFPTIFTSFGYSAFYTF